MISPYTELPPSAVTHISHEIGSKNRFRDSFSLKGEAFGGNLQLLQ